MNKNRDPHNHNLAAWDKVASVYEKQFMNFDLYDDTYDAFSKLIRINGRLLDVGCGPGNISSYIKKIRPDLTIEGVDASPAMIALAKKNNPGSKFHVLDCRRLPSLERTFDAIAAGFCIPYLTQSDCADLIRDCATMILQHGVCYFSFIEGNYDESGEEKGSVPGLSMIVHYYSGDWFAEQLKINGLLIQGIYRKYYESRSGQRSTHLIIVAAKQE
jgi:SAM-dependent methyltransferase